MSEDYTLTVTTLHHDGVSRTTTTLPDSSRLSAMQAFRAACRAIDRTRDYVTLHNADGNLIAHHPHPAPTDTFLDPEPSTFNYESLLPDPDPDQKD